jgi:hypothetical protein
MPEPVKGSVLLDLLRRFEQALSFGPCFSLPMGRLTATIGAKLGICPTGQE